MNEEMLRKWDAAFSSAVLMGFREGMPLVKKAIKELSDGFGIPFILDYEFKDNRIELKYLADIGSLSLSNVESSVWKLSHDYGNYEIKKGKTELQISLRNYNGDCRVYIGFLKLPVGSILLSLLNSLKAQYAESGRTFIRSQTNELASKLRGKTILLATALPGTRGVKAILGDRIENVLGATVVEKITRKDIPDIAVYEPGKPSKILSQAKQLGIPLITYDDLYALIGRGSISGDPISGELLKRWSSLESRIFQAITSVLNRYKVI